ncbi:MAG: division/cell wall cluster transcriptional repressor MraZ [Bacteroidia bacterium]
MVSLHGVYPCTADDKGRIMMPAPLKEQFQRILKKGFIIKRSIFSKALELYPVSTWSEMIKEISRLNRFSKKNSDFIRMFNYGVQPLVLDNTNRFLITKDLADFAGIKKDVVMASAIDHVEIWDQKAYHKFIKDNSAKFESLTEEVMGKGNGINE